MLIRTIIILIAIIIFPGASAQVGQKSLIELNDGTVIPGEIISLNGGVYTIKSDSLGVQKIDASKIRAIRMQDPMQQSGQHPTNPNQPSATNGTPDTKSLQERMMADEEIMDMIKSLQNDPEFKKILEDPEFQKAVNSGDVNALIANPRFMSLLNNRTVKEITEKTLK